MYDGLGHAVYEEAKKDFDRRVLDFLNAPYNGLTVTGTAADGKTYDGTAAAVAHIGTVKGIVDTDKGDVTVEIKTAEFEDRNAGNGRNVSVSYQVTGTKAGNYTAPESDKATADIEKRRVTLTSGSAAKVYDGIPLTNHEVQDTLDGSASEKGFVNGEGALYTVTGSQTTAGSSKNTFTYVLNGETIEDNYTITAAEGDLTVSKVSEEIIITAASGTKVYDGTALTDDGFTCTEGILAEGDILSAAVEGSITDVGTAANRVTSYKVMRGDMDVTFCYTFGTSVDGTLEVTKRKLAKPSADRTDFTYSGSEQGPVISGYDERTMTAAGKGKETAAGNYTLTYALKDIANNCWSDETAADVTIDWSIARAVYDMSGVSFAGWEGTELKKPETIVIIEKGSRGDRSYKAVWNPEQDGSSSSSAAAAEWIPDRDGWRYRFADGTYAADGWHELANPYAGNGQEKTSWFHFGVDTYMNTGWFTDKNGRKYYLHPVSDGTMGRMYHGKQTIGGKEYEFSETHDGYYGHLTETGT